MILFADDITKNDVRHIWEVCFGDTQEFMDMYFTHKYSHENTLIYIEQGKTVAAIQFLPYSFTFYGREIPISYISGASTLPEYRGKGYMGKLLLESFKIMQQRNIPLSILIPAEDWLYNYYARFGYETVFEEDSSTIIDLRKIITQADGDIEKAYIAFDKLYRSLDFTLQKTMPDFTAIIKDMELEGFSPRANLAGMARVIDAQALLNIYSSVASNQTFGFQLTDEQLPENNACYEVSDGVSHIMENTSTLPEQISVNTLCRLLFGFHLNELKTPLARYFKAQHAVMNLMLE